MKFVLSTTLLEQGPLETASELHNLNAHSILNINRFVDLFSYLYVDFKLDDLYNFNVRRYDTLEYKDKLNIVDPSSHVFRPDQHLSAQCYNDETNINNSSVDPHARFLDSDKIDIHSFAGPCYNNDNINNSSVDPHVRYKYDVLEFGSSTTTTRSTSTASPTPSATSTSSSPASPSTSTTASSTSSTTSSANDRINIHCFADPFSYLHVFRPDEPQHLHNLNANINNSFVDLLSYVVLKLDVRLYSAVACSSGVGSPLG